MCNAVECPLTCLQSAGQTHSSCLHACMFVREFMLAEIKLQVQQSQPNATGDRFLQHGESLITQRLLLSGHWDICFA